VRHRRQLGAGLHMPLGDTWIMILPAWQPSILRFS
jgi:hypothetical protein